jgi:hypothetical protein
MFLKAVMDKQVTEKVIKDFVFDCPLGMVNVIVLANCLCFYMLGIVQKSFWIIDAVWNFMPVFMAVAWR